MIDGPGQIMLLAVDIYVNLVFVPPLSTGFHGIAPVLADLHCTDRPEPMPLMCHRFITDIDALFAEQVFHTSKKLRETDEHLYCKADDLATR